LGSTGRYLHAPPTDSSARYLRDQYLGENGLRLLFDGIYSRHQAVAAMVGVLLDPRPQVLPPLLGALGDKFAPSDVFPAAAQFDTEHERDAAVAPSHDTIRVAHLFFEFGYATSTTQSRTRCERSVAAYSTGDFSSRISANVAYARLLWIA
jgi:hypothetical protein